MSVKLRLGHRAKVRRVGVHLPGRVSGGVTVLVNGAPAPFTASGRTVSVKSRGGLRRLSVVANVGGRGQGKSVVVTMRNGKLAIPLR